MDNANRQAVGKNDFKISIFEYGENCVDDRLWLCHHISDFREQPQDRVREDM